MKVGDLVKLDPSAYSVFAPAPRTTVGRGVGVVLRVITGGSHRKNPSAEVMWSSLNRSEWHAGCVLEVIQ